MRPSGYERNEDPAHKEMADEKWETEKNEQHNDNLTENVEAAPKSAHRSHKQRRRAKARQASIVRWGVTLTGAPPSPQPNPIVDAPSQKRKVMNEPKTVFENGTEETSYGANTRKRKCIKELRSLLASENGRFQKEMSLGLLLKAAVRHRTRSTSLHARGMASKKFSKELKLTDMRESKNPTCVKRTGTYRKTVDKARTNLLKRLEDESKSGDELAKEDKATLPDGLVEMIIARMPFPSLLKARVLNKSWSAKFCCMGSPSHGKSAFHNHVMSCSHNWAVHCPLFSDKQGFLEYDRASKRWQRIFTPCYRRNNSSPVTQTGVGSLICEIWETSPGSRQYYTIVMNQITRHWKQLPSRQDRRFPTDVHVLPAGRDGYKVLAVADDFGTDVCVEIYNSSAGSWCLKRLPIVSYSKQLVVLSSSYFHKHLYILYADNRKVPRLLVEYNLDDSSWAYVSNQFPPVRVQDSIKLYKLLVCGSRIMIVIVLDHDSVGRGRDADNYRSDQPGVFYTRTDSILIYGLDAESSDIKLLSKGPPETIFGAASDACVCDDVGIYFVADRAASVSPVVVYNMLTREWSHLPPPPFYNAASLQAKTLLGFAFRPGLNPFAKL